MSSFAQESGSDFKSSVLQGKETAPAESLPSIQTVAHPVDSPIKTNAEIKTELKTENNLVKKKTLAPATPVIVLAPNSKQFISEASIKNIVTNLQSRDTMSLLTDTKNTTNQFVFKLMRGVASSSFIGFVLTASDITSNSVLTDPSNQKSASSIATNGLTDPILSIGTRFDRQGFSMIADLNSQIPSLSVKSVTSGSSAYKEQISTNIQPLVATGLTVFSNHMKKIILGGSVSYQKSASSRVEKTFAGGQSVQIDYVGGNKSTLSGFIESPIHKNVLGLLVSVFYTDPIERRSNNIVIDEDPTTDISGQIYYNWNLSKIWSFYPAFLYQKSLTNFKNGVQIDRNDSLNLSVTTRYIF